MKFLQLSALCHERSSSIAFLQREKVTYCIQFCSIEHEMLSLERARSIIEVLKNVIVRDSFDTILVHIVDLWFPA